MKLIKPIFYLTLAVITINLSSCTPRATVVVKRPAPVKKVVVVKKKPAPKRIVVVRKY